MILLQDLRRLLPGAGLLLLGDGDDVAVWVTGGCVWALLALVVAARAAPPRRWGVGALAVAGVAAAMLVLIPGLTGNAANESPAGVVVAANAVHMLAASIWAGGIASLLWAVRPAAGMLPQAERGSLLVASAERFSAIALIAVVALALTGVVQGLVLVGRIDGLVTSGYGRLVMVKGALLCLLALAGAVHRARTLPQLRSASGAAQPRHVGEAGFWRLLGGEAAVLALVLAVTAILAGTRPPGERTQAVSAGARIGVVDVTVTARPGRPGPNTLQIEFAPGARVPAGLAVSATQPRLGIGPLTLRAVRSDARRLTVAGAPLDAPGTWEVTLTEPRGTRAIVRLRLR